MLVAVFLPFMGTVVAQQKDPTYGGDVGYSELVTAENGIKFSVKNASTIYSDQADFSLKFSAYQNTPNNMMSRGVFLYNVSYSASWLNEPQTVYQWSINNPANLDDDDENPQISVETTVKLEGVPQGEQRITVSSCGGGYLLITQGDETIYETFAKNSTATLVFTISGATPATPTPTINNEEILWETSISWNLAGTPAQNYWDTDIFSKSRTWTPPVVDEDIVYAAAESTITLNTYGNPEVSWLNVYAFNIVNGAKIWSYQGNYSTTSITNLVVSEGVVYFAAGNYVSALNASNGKLLWRTACPTGTSNPAVGQGKIVFGSGNSIIALDTIEGNIVWNFTTDGAIASSPAISNGVVYVGSNDENLYALDAADGEKIWSFKGQDGFEGTPVISHGTVYTGSSDGYMYALRPTDGTKIWSYDTNADTTGQTHCVSSPVVDDGVLFFTSSGAPSDTATNYGSGTGTVYAFSISSGQLIWSTKVDGKCSAPVVDNLVYVLVLSGRLAAFRVDNGESVWSFSNAETTPTIINNVAYFACNGQICAVKTLEEDFSGLPVNVEYSINYTMFAIWSAIVIALTILIIYSYHKPLMPKVKMPSIKKKSFKKKDETQED